MQNQVQINKTQYKLLKKRHHTNVWVYIGANSVLKIGARKDIFQELKMHQQILKLEFPVPKILNEGRYKNLYFYIEEYYGAKSFGPIFESDCSKDWKISNAHFNAWLEITEQFLRAQLRTKTIKKEYKKFFDNLHLDMVSKEFPELKQNLKKFEKTFKQKLKQVPFVISHLDFNPYNVFAKGVIDLDRLSYAPLGYDLIANITTVDFFPREKGYEYQAKYWFTEQQIYKYMLKLSELNTPNYAALYYKEFFICRAVWASARMEQWPKLREWRRKALAYLLSEYLGS